MTDIVEVHTGPSALTEVSVSDGWQVQVTEQHPTLHVVSTDTAFLNVTAPIVAVVEVITPGPSGPQGVEGERGETGPSPTFEQHFAVPTEVWVINHPLNAYPVTTTVDLNGEEIIGDVMTPDKSTVVVTFYMPVAGTARLKA